MRVDGRRWRVAAESELLEFYDDSFESVYRCAAQLTRGDSHAAEDLVQDAYVRLVRAAREGSAEEVGVGWMLTTVRRLYVDRLRSSEREQRRLRLVASEPVVADDLLRTPVQLDALNARERAALIFRYVHDLPIAEVADLLGCSVRATESLLQRAKRRARRSEGA